MYAHYHNTTMVNTVADCTGTIRLLHLATSVSSFHDDKQKYDQGSDDDY